MRILSRLRRSCEYTNYIRNIFIFPQTIFIQTIDGSLRTPSHHLSLTPLSLAALTLVLPTVRALSSVPPPPPPLSQPGLYPSIISADPSSFLDTHSGAVVVCGAGSGIGEQLARLYASKGRTVYACSRTLVPSKFDGLER